MGSCEYDIKLQGYIKNEVFLGHFCMRITKEYYKEYGNIHIHLLKYSMFGSCRRLEFWFISFNTGTENRTPQGYT
jgi:hypothetical protein